MSDDNALPKRLPRQTRRRPRLVNLTTSPLILLQPKLQMSLIRC